MKYRVRLTARAERDVDAVLAWFAQQQASAAGARWLAQLWQVVRSLEQMPDRCALAAEAGEIGLEVHERYLGRRQGRYRVLFRIEGREVLILHVRHAARDRLQEGEL